MSRLSGYQKAERDCSHDHRDTTAHPRWALNNAQCCQAHALQGQVLPRPDGWPDSVISAFTRSLRGWFAIRSPYSERLVGVLFGIDETPIGVAIRDIDPAIDAVHIGRIAQTGRVIVASGLTTSPKGADELTVLRVFQDYVIAIACKPESPQRINRGTVQALQPLVDAIKRRGTLRAAKATKISAVLRKVDNRGAVWQPRLTADLRQGRCQWRSEIAGGAPP